MGAELCFNYHCNGCRQVIDVLDIFPSGNMETEGANIAGNTASLGITRCAPKHGGGGDGVGSDVIEC